MAFGCKRSAGRKNNYSHNDPNGLTLALAIFVPLIDRTLQRVGIRGKADVNLPASSLDILPAGDL